MIDFSQKTYAKLFEQMLGRVSEEFDKRDTSPIPTALGPAAWALEGYYLELNQVQRQAFIQTASGQALDYLAQIAGLTRSQATPAVRLGVFNLAVPIGSRFSTINGKNSINFVVTSAVTDTTFQLTSETVGSIGNDYTGAILPITAIPGLTSAQLTDTLIHGTDTQTDTAFRKQLIEALTSRPFGGNIASYRTEILSIGGVGAVQVYPVWNGGGTVKCSILGSDFLPASPTLMETVQQKIDPPPDQGLGLGLAPIGASVTIGIPETVPIHISADLTLAPGYFLGQVEPLIQEALEGYLLEMRQGWDTPAADGLTYFLCVYLSRIVMALVMTQGVVNATNVQINGRAADLNLIQTGVCQQIPVLGTVTLHG